MPHSHSHFSISFPPTSSSQISISQFLAIPPNIFFSPKSEYSRKRSMPRKSSIPGKAMEMEENSDRDRDWTDLPPELVQLLSDRLTVTDFDFLDLIYFHGTCKAWNLPVALSHATPCHPWLFDSYKSFNSSFNFYSFTSSTTISIPSSKFNLNVTQRVYSTSINGFLLSYQRDTTSCSLINPLTGTEIVLPPFESFIVVPSHPPRLLWAYDNIVISIISGVSEIDGFHLTLHRLTTFEDSSKWTSVQCLIYKRDVAYEFYDEMYFINDGFDDKTTVRDASNGGGILYQVEALPFEYGSKPFSGERLLKKCTYLVQSSASGELLRILKITYQRINRRMLCRYLFFVYQLVNEDANSHWLKISGIGDEAIFLNEFDALSLSTNEYPILKKNSIYFMKPVTKRVNGDEADDNPFNNHHTVIVASRYDLGTGIVEDFPYIMNYWGSWFVPKPFD